MYSLLIKLVLISSVLLGIPASFAYSSKTPTLMIEVGQHTGIINRMALNHSAGLLATVSDDKTLRLWNLPEGTFYATLRVPIGEQLQGALYSVALAPDGKTVITGGETGNPEEKFSLYVFDVEKRVLKARIADIPSAIYHLSYSKDGRYIAAGLAGGFGIRVWDSQTGKLVAQDTDYQQRCSWLEFSDSQQLVSVSHDGYIRLYDQNFALIKKINVDSKGTPYSIKFSSDQRLIAVGYSNLARVDIFDNHLNHQQSIEIAGLNSSNAAIVEWQTGNSPHGIWVSGNIQNQDGKYLIRHWNNIDKPSEYRDIPVASNIVTDLITDPDNANKLLFATAEPSWGSIDQDQIAFKNQAKLWDARVVELPQRVFYSSSDGLSIAYSDKPENNRVNFFKLQKLTLESIENPSELSDVYPPIIKNDQFDIVDWRRAIPVINHHPLTLDKHEKSLAVALNPLGGNGLIGTNFHLRLINTQGQEIAKKTMASEVYGLNITRNGKLAIAALGDGTIRWYSLAEHELLEELVAFFPYDDGKAWLVWTKEGFFAHSDSGGHQLAGYQVNKGDNKRPEWFSFSQLYQSYYAPELIVPKLLRQEQFIEDRLKAVETPGTMLTKHSLPVINLIDYCYKSEQSTTRGFIRDKTLQVPVATDDATMFRTRFQQWLARINSWMQHKFQVSLVSLSQNSSMAEVKSDEPAPASQALTCVSLGGRGDTRAFTRQKSNISPAIYRNSFDHPVTSITLRYSVQSRDSGTGDIDVYVNDQIQQSLKESSANADGREMTQELVLAGGLNRIFIQAYDNSGAAFAQSGLIELKNPEVEQTNATKAPQPKMIVLAIGINAYPAPNQLEYAVKDATDFLNVISEFKSDTYREVVKFSLMDQQATLQNIEGTVDKIASMVEKNDTVLIYLSGHGIKEGQNYYFIPFGVDDKNLAQTALSQARVKASIAKLSRTNHIFMFIDSCHSGAVDLAKIDQDIASIDKIKHQLGENIFILAAAGENQEAQDQFKTDTIASSNNGLFAYAILEGLKGKARRLDDNIVDNFNLGSYVQRRVDALTKNQTLYKQKARFQLIEIGDILTFDLTKYQ